MVFFSYQQLKSRNNFFTRFFELAQLLAASYTLTLKNSFKRFALPPTGIILLLAICYPFLTASQSRGESGQVRLPITTAVQGYLRERQQKLPYLTQPYSPNEQIFFQQQTQVQSYPQHVQPEYYPSQPSYSQPNNQPSHQSYPQSGFVAPLTPFPVPSPDKQVYQRPQPQSNNLVNRFGGEQAQSYQPTSAEEFTSRPTRPPGAVRTTKKPQVFTPPRFDDRGDSNVRKTLVFDPVLSNSMEGFSLELLFNFVVSEPNTNFMVSPFSVYHMLVLIAEGAKDKTYDEISSKLRLGDIQKTRDFQQYLNTVLRWVGGNLLVILEKFDDDAGKFF